MSRIDETRRYKWSNSATNLLVSIWSHDMVQSRLKLSTRNQPIWESIARFMGRKGFDVTGLQCRTRIKNMLCNYYESVRKKDRNYIEPYFDLFQKVVNNRNKKRKDTKTETSKRFGNFELDDHDRDMAASSESSLDIEQSTSQKNCDINSGIDYFDVSNEEVQVMTPLMYRETISNLQNVITKAIDNQTKAISEAVRIQTEIVEKLLVSERERLEAIILAEKESRKQLEERMDRLLTRLESNINPQPFIGPLIES